MLPSFDLLTPQTLSEALEMLARGSPEVVPLAGGTNVIVNLRSRRFRPEVLMDLGKLTELHGIRVDDGHIIVGGGTTIAQLMADPLIAEHGSPLGEAAAAFGNPLIRNRATVAGNLVDASPAADMAPPLLALNAEVALVSREGTRYVSLQDFIVGPNETILLPSELLLAVRWPIPPPDSAAAHQKIGLRKGTACAVISAAVRVEYDGGGSCRDVRIALGAVAPKPVRAYAAEETLRDQLLTSEVVSRAARLSTEATNPIDDIRGSASYRRQMAETLVSRLLTQVAGRATRGGNPCSPKL
jgi:CO/xanthine dehydrogenase FAD-binding subunit